MEDHVDLTRGRQRDWHKLVKEAVFPSEDHISVNKIRDKTGNMRRAYNKAKQMQKLSGWPLVKDNVEPTVRDRLERVCPFFWRLDEIWCNAGGQGEGEGANSPVPTPSSTPAVSKMNVDINDLSAHRIPLQPLATSHSTRSQSLIPSLLPAPPMFPLTHDSGDDEGTDKQVTMTGTSQQKQRQRHTGIRGGSGVDIEVRSDWQLERRLQHEREMHAEMLASQERVAAIQASSQERIAANHERTMQALISAITSYRRREREGDDPPRSRSASPPRLNV